jgi:hypothetical protein
MKYFIPKLTHERIKSVDLKPVFTLIEIAN